MLLALVIGDAMNFWTYGLSDTTVLGMSNMTAMFSAFVISHSRKYGADRGAGEPGSTGFGTRSEGLASVFSTHMDTGKPIARLRAMAAGAEPFGRRLR